MLIREGLSHLNAYFVPGASLMSLHLVVVINLRAVNTMIPFCRWGTKHHKDLITQLWSRDSNLHLSGVVISLSLLCMQIFYEF